jgi:thioredoxin reductase (NADPH)
MMGTVGATDAAPLAETPDLHGAFPRLSDDQIGMLERQGERRRTQPEEVLFREGDDHYDFYVVLEGMVAVISGYGGPYERLIAVHGPGRFLGELGLLTGRAALYTAVVREPGEVLVVPLEHLRNLISQDSALGDLILRAYLLRREMLIGLSAGFTIVGSRYSPDTRRLREFCARNRLPTRWIDVEQDDAAETLLREVGVSPAETPVVIWRGREVLRNPSNEELARVVGLRRERLRGVCDLVVVGTGPSGLAASVYGASEGLGTIALEAVATGGQAGTSPKIENYLGFPAGISGAELAERATIQAEKFGARITVPAEATALREEDGHYVVTLADGGSVSAHTVVIATGVRYRRLDVPRMDEFETASVYYAATLMEARLCRGDPVAVVGGGNSAGQATMFLARYARPVHLIVREADVAEHMSRYLVDRIEQDPAVEVHLHTEVRELVGENGILEGLVIEDNQTGERRTLPARVLFVFIGAQPHTAWLADQVALDERGFILTGPEAVRDGNGVDPSEVPLPLETSRAGVLAVGDVRSGSIKRVASAVGEGSMALRMVFEHLTGERQPPQLASRENRPTS